MNNLNLYNGSGLRAQGELAHSQKLLSVIIPAYNTAKFLNKCVDSVVNQTYKNIEIIIVDDGSSDSTPQICDELANKYNNIKIIHQENKGSNIARHNGFNASRGEYIAFVDSDDYIDLNAYAKAIQVLEENDCDMVQFGMRLVDFDGKVMHEWPRDNMKLGNTRDIFYYYLTNKAEAWSMVDKVYKRWVFDGIEWPKISMAEDFCTSSQLFSKVKNFASISDFLYYYVKNPASISNDKPNEKTKNTSDKFIAGDFVFNLTREKFPELLPEALARKIGLLAGPLSNFSDKNIWKQAARNVRDDYIIMRNELKARGIEFNINKAANRKDLIHAHYLATHPKLYKLYLTTRLAINKLTGI